MKAITVGVFIWMGIFGNWFCKAEDELKIAIEQLQNSQNIEQATGTLFQANRNNSEKLATYQVELGRAVNTQLSKHEFNYYMCTLALELAANNLIDLDQDSEEKLVATNRKIRKSIKQTTDYQSWIWNDEAYIESRNNAGLIMDLLGYAGGVTSLEELEKSLSLSSYLDNRLRFFAAASIIRRNKKVDNEVLRQIAADDETRGLLYNYLKAGNNFDIYPKEFFNQEDLARADMVNWLLYPAELGRVPTEIDLVEIFRVEYKDVGPADFYLWKFRANDDTWEEEGWMVGLSGEFIVSDIPTMDTHGYTFSAFSKFEEKTPEEHFDEIMGTMEDWNKQNQ